MLRASWIAACTLVIDQLTKIVLTWTVQPGHSVPVVSPILQLTYVQNTGAAFGLLKGQQLLFVLLSLVVIAAIIWELATKGSRVATVTWGCGLVLGGAIGNLIDRLRVGYVIDFLDLRVWPVFNVADSAITIGVALLILHSLGHEARGTGRGRK